MRRAAVLACVAALLACATADRLEIKTLQEDTSTPGVTGGTYAIVQDGRVVGVVQHYRSEGAFGGRRGGPSDDRLATPAAQRLSELWASQADALVALRDRLMALRCLYARQMALARLQAAAAAAAGGAEHPMLHRPSVGAASSEPFEGEASEPGFPGMPFEDAHHGPGPMLRRPSVEAKKLPGPQRPDAAYSQDPADHPEDLVNLNIVQQQLLGAEEEEEEAATAGSMPLMFRTAVEPVDGAADGAATKSVNPDAPVLVEEYADEQPALLGAGGRPLMHRMPAGGSSEPQPASAWAEPQPAQAEQEGIMPLMALVWARIAGLPVPRLPAREEPEPMPVPMPRMFGGGPHRPVPLMERHPAHHHHDCMHGHGPAPHHDHHHQMPMPHMMEGGEVVVQTPDGRWMPFSETAKPAHPHKPEMEWSLYGADGSLNYGLVAFVALAVACAAVWGAMLVQFAVYRSARDNHNAATYFITRTDSSDDETAALKPLLHEGFVKPAAGEVAGADAGVEHASSHVAGGRNVTVLHYEPLNSSPKQ